MWSWGRSTAGVEERKQDLRHLVEVLVAQAAEEQGARLCFGKLRNGGAEGPRTGGIVRDIEEEVRSFSGGDQLQAPGPSGVANALLYCSIRDIVTNMVT